MDDAKRLGLALRGKWLIEFAEFLTVKKTDVDDMKRFLAQTADRYTPMYGRTEVVQPRSCVFVGTANRGQFLPEAGRRWWVAEVVRRIDLELLQRDRDQLLAEALYRYRAGERWWLPPELEQHQAEHVAGYAASDHLSDAIEEWWDGMSQPHATWDEIIAGLMAHGAIVGRYDGVVTRVDMRDQRAIGAALRSLGWRQHDRGHGKKPRKVWIPPPPMTTRVTRP
jgi:predicted P-loop ATPase